ncbi:MAG: hypothetical protein HZY76_11260 [Anaerolineae bacterium]|nr:MAG: hypothetical protein HZY76_11260 [Anaerolineae bacterium]
MALVDAGRATTVGRPTAGGSGNPVTFRLSGGGLALFYRRFPPQRRPADRRPGHRPGCLRRLDGRDLRLGRDPDLAAADRP